LIDQCDSSWRGRRFVFLLPFSFPPGQSSFLFVLVCVPLLQLWTSRVFSEPIFLRASLVATPMSAYSFYCSVSRVGCFFLATSQGIFLSSHPPLSLSFPSGESFSAVGALSPNFPFTLPEGPLFSPTGTYRDDVVHFPPRSLPLFFLSFFFGHWCFFNILFPSLC